MVSPEILYLNHFNVDGTSFWVGNDGMNYAELDEGYYYFESLDSSLRFNAPTFSIEKDQNFSVEISIINPADEDSLFYGLMVGGFSPQNYTIDYLINDIGQYKIGTNVSISSGNYKMGNTSEARKLKILKKDETTYFFINDSLIYNYVLDKFLVTIKSHLFWPLFSSSFVKNPRQRNGCLRFLPRLIKK